MPSTVLGQYAVTLPADTTANRPSATTGMVRYNTTLGVQEMYNGTGWVSVTKRKVVTVLASGTSWTVPEGVASFDVLVCAGGGAGGLGSGGAGGGAGGVIDFTTFNYNSSYSTASYSIGAGGSAILNNDTIKNSGTNSTFTYAGTTLTAVGGGGGGGENAPNAPGANGGSGGGSAYNGYQAPGNGTAGQGYAGGRGGSTYGGGGGGGAGGVGGDSSPSGWGSGGGRGGPGMLVADIGAFIAGGGGGGFQGGSDAGPGGKGGGGWGSTFGGTSSSWAQDGQFFGGGGGGNGADVGITGAGHAGCVIIRYNQ